MKVPGLFPRELFVILISSCLLFLIFAPPAHAQNSFTYPPFPLTSGAGLQVNGTATVGTGSLLQLTPALGDQVGSAWYTNPAGQGEGGAATLALSGGFSTTFTFQFTNPGSDCCAPGADGIAFVVQNGGFNGYMGDSTSGALAVGPNDGAGGEIGFTGLTNSVAVQFDTFCNTGGGSYGDTCAAGGPTSADQITVESCGTAANTVTHNTSCQFGTVDLSTFGENHIYIGDGNVHTVQIQYVPPATPSSPCPALSSSSAPGCGTLTVMVDSQTVLSVPFNLGIISGYSDPTDSAFVGFTGATGGSYQVQDVNSWSFGVTVTQTFNTNAATTSNFSTTGGENEQTLDLSTATNLTCNGQSGSGCPPITLLTTNNTVSASSTWPQYVNGTPWATSVCAARPANGGTGNLCSLFVNACFGGSITQSQADDFYCPTATPGDGTITLSDTWDPLDPKPTIATGTTVSLIDFVPSAPGQTWTPSTIGQTTPNSACTNVSTPFQCELSDTLNLVYGDQTTTRGSKPKKGWIVTVFNVPMITTQWSVLSGTGCPTGGVNLNNNPASATTWFNSSCQLQYQANQATVSGANTNNFVAAPPASITYGLNAAIMPVSSDASNTNGTLVSPWIVDPGSINTVIGGLDSQNPLQDGTYILHWSAVDNVGISEKNVQLDQTPKDTCNNPVPTADTPSTFSAPCYNTNLFTTTINVDSTPPTISSAGFSPAGSPTGTFSVGETVYPIFACSDNKSGLSNCGGAPVSCPLNLGPATLTSPNKLDTSSAGLKQYTATATDCAGNTSSTIISYTVAPSDNLQINTIPLLTLSTGIPGLIPITFGAAITNLSTAPADDVTVTTTFSTLPSGVVLGTPTATISTVSCSNSPCTLKGITISTTQCSVSWPTVTCGVPTLGAVSSKTGLWMEIIVPVAKNSKTGKFTSTSTVSSAGTDPVLSNNTVTQTYTIF
jgi:lectin family protein